jgi:hypothetical protein
MGKSPDKLNALAGIAAVSAVIAMVLILSNLPILTLISSDFASQMPAWSGSFDNLLAQLIQFRVPLPSMVDAIALVAIAGFVALSVTSTVAASKLTR